MPPSKEKYDREHPVVSVRASKDLFAEIEALRAQGRSLGDIFRVGIGRQNAANQSIEGTRKEGYEQGYAAARQIQGDVPLQECGNLIEVTGEQSKAFAGAALEHGGWGHTQCPERRRVQGS